MKPVVLVILDGWGSSWWKKGNAIKTAHTPFIDEIEKNWSSTLLKSYGENVGLPPKHVGTSEDGRV